MFRPHQNKLVARAVLAMTCLLLQGYVSAIDHEKTNDAFHFVEMKSADGVILNSTDKHFLYGEVASYADICSKESEFYCFDAKFVEFYIPKKLGRRREWTHGQRIYCVVQSFREDGDKKSEQRSPESRLSIIFSRPSGTCSQGENFDLKAMYSSTHGLRALFVNSSSASMELLSTDKLGFGAQHQDP